MKKRKNLRSRTLDQSRGWVISTPQNGVLVYISVRKKNNKREKGIHVVT